MQQNPIGTGIKTGLQNTVTSSACFRLCTDTWFLRCVDFYRVADLQSPAPTCEFGVLTGEARTAGLLGVSISRRPVAGGVFALTGVVATPIAAAAGAKGTEKGASRTETGFPMVAGPLSSSR